MQDNRGEGEHSDNAVLPRRIMGMKLPIIESCDGCGACCMEQESPPGYISFLSYPEFAEEEDYTGDAERFKNLPPHLLDELKEYHARLLSNSPPPGDQPCIWLDLETRKCKHYEHRPSICRDMEMGGDACRAWRKDAGMDIDILEALEGHNDPGTVHLRGDNIRQRSIDGRL